MINERISGVLLHITSLPSKYGIGDLGYEAYNFVNFLQETGQKVWQILPIGPTGYTNSPYSCESALAGNPELISFEKLKDIGLLTEEELSQVPEHNPDFVDFGGIYLEKDNLLRIAFQRFKDSLDENLKNEFHNFCDSNNWWLHDYGVFMAVTEEYKRNGHNGDWSYWEPPILCHTEESVKEYDVKLGDDVLYNKFQQYIFYKQWYELKAYANERGIKMLGDIPINVAFDSADVWANPHLFLLDENRKPVVVAGIPDDNGGEGQKWGNPLFNWEELRKTNYDWLVKRMAKNLEIYDIVRLDHFTAYVHYWAIPFAAETANEGQWLQTPGEELFQAFTQAFGENLPIVVEDFGINTTQEVFELRDRYACTGMKILQFGFSGDENNPYLPQNFETENSLCYTGNHDNNTIRGWFNSISDNEKSFLLSITQTDGNNINWDMIKMALMSKSNLAIYQMQDLLDLDENARMNNPGMSQNNWAWRFRWESVTPELKIALKSLTEESGR
ncbi:MAG: 4-alpha-glucanotransferase [Candidatus Sericytochromatia bacterium]